MKGYTEWAIWQASVSTADQDCTGIEPVDYDGWIIWGIGPMHTNGEDEHIFRSIVELHPAWLEEEYDLQYEDERGLTQYRMSEFYRLVKDGEIVIAWEHDREMCPCTEEVSP